MEDRCKMCGHLMKLHNVPKHLREFNDNRIYCSARNCTCTVTRYNKDMMQKEVAKDE